MRTSSLVIMVILFTTIIAGAVFLRNSYKEGTLQEQIIQKAIPAYQNSTDSSFIQKALGMDATRTYLVLFLNNTEMRPGGGFIGSYAVIKVVRGEPQIIKVEGSEALDNSSPSVGLEPNPALAKYLGIKKLQFRDSNWSPDFSSNAKLALELYKLEGGVESGSIDGVVGVTPTLFEEVLKITGPIKVGDIEFNSENFTEKLEYEVEYGYKDRGRDFSERKKLLSELSHALLPKLLTTGFTRWNDYIKLVPKMLKEKQILLYSVNEEEQNYILSQGYGGVFLSSAQDYLLWTDANLGALKTDVAIKRTLSYSVSPTTSGLVAVATMRYNHTGGFTWRTTRYRDYVRIFVPNGSKIISVAGATDPSVNPSKNNLPDIGDEGGYRWFGSYIVVEPGKTNQLTFTYLLPKNISEQIMQGAYNLVVQKQSGTGQIRLTLDLDFGKNLASATPPEAGEKFGDDVYEVTTDLREDRNFSVLFR